MARAGIDRETGRLLTGWEHCAQSIAVVLTTRIGWRVMRREFGSRLRDLQDRNPDPATMLAAFVSIAEALARWEPGFRLSRITPERIGVDGVTVLTLSGAFYPRGHLGDYSVSEQREASYGGAGDRFRVLA
jgi:phage baseplate assembly protein W